VRPAIVSAGGISAGDISTGDARTVMRATQGRDRTRAESPVRQGGAS
jgi:hypothetical protein